MKRLAVYLVMFFCMSSVAFAASAKKKKVAPSPGVAFDVDSCVDKAIDYRTLMATNPYDNIGKCYWLGFPMIKQQMLSRSVALIGFAGGQQNVFALMDFGKESVPMGMISGLVMGMGAYEYETVSGSVNTVHHLRKLDGYLERTKKQQAEKDAIDKIKAEEQARLDVAHQKANELALKDAEIYSKEMEIKKEKERRILEVLRAKEQAEEAEKVRLHKEQLRIENEKSQARLDQKMRESGLEINDDMIIDKNSGLMWVIDINYVAPRDNTYAKLLKWADNFRYAGYSDWRIPTSQERTYLSKYAPEIVALAMGNLQNRCNSSGGRHRHCYDIKHGITKDCDWLVRGGDAPGWFSRAFEHYAADNIK